MSALRKRATRRKPPSPPPPQHEVGGLKPPSLFTIAPSAPFADALARGLIVEIQHPTLDVVRSIANPVRFSSTPVLYRLPPPLLGEHSLEILQSLDYSSDQMATAVRDRAV